jgi:predicted permease
MFFVFFVLLPLLIISNMKTGNEDTDKFDNGIDQRSAPMMLMPFFDSLRKNMKKKIKFISDD